MDLSQTALSWFSSSPEIAPSATPPNRIVRWVFYATMVFLYLPLCYLVFQAFLVNPLDWHEGFTLGWFKALLREPELLIPLLTSIEIGLGSACLATIIGTLGAVGIEPFKERIPGLVQSLIMLPLLLPEVITGLSLLLFFLVARIELGFVTVMIAHASFSASFVYLIVAEQLRKLDPQIMEAAQDLGAEPISAFFRVTLPNIIPGVMGGWLLAFTLSFDDFLISFFASGAGVTTLPLKIYSMMRTGITPEINGLSCIMIVLSVSLVLILVSRESSRRWVFRG